MNNSKYYPLALEALVELAPEIAAARTQSQPAPVRPTLEDILEGFGNFPAGALYLGMADDNLPVLLNLYDPLPGPLLLISDEKAGKTELLKSLALASSRMYGAEEVQFSVTTHAIEDWENLESLPHCAGVIPIQGNDARELVTSLYDWAHQNGGSQQVVLFLLDGLDKTSDWDETTNSQLRWLLMRGPSRRVWPILTLNSTMFGDAKEWFSLFKTFIYGRISNSSLANVLTGAGRANLDSLREGVQFSMKEGNHWLRFWIPSPS